MNVWAIIEQILTLLEDDEALGRPVPWASGLGRLLVLPHAGYQDNAFYDRDTGALHLFYFEGPDGKPVYTCLSHDIVAHELGHAVLDGLKPGYNEVSSPETAGFHEYFGDAIAMLASLNNREIAQARDRGGAGTVVGQERRLGHRQRIRCGDPRTGQAGLPARRLEQAQDERLARHLRGA